MRELLEQLESRSRELAESGSENEAIGKIIASPSWPGNVTATRYALKGESGSGEDTTWHVGVRNDVARYAARTVINQLRNEFPEYRWVAINTGHGIDIKRHRKGGKKEKYEIVIPMRKKKD